MFLKQKRYFNWLVVSRHQAMCRPTGTSIETRLTLRTDEHYIADLDRLYRVEAINTLLELMRGGKDERVRGNGGSGTPRPRLGQGEGQGVYKR